MLVEMKVDWDKMKVVEMAELKDFSSVQESAVLMEF